MRQMAPIKGGSDFIRGKSRLPRRAGRGCVLAPPPVKARMRRAITVGHSFHASHENQP
ncbi:hypothetical protein [Lysobacter gummosus]|uniref:hypothetical protein n=1 Tax=Lysobacter gummosus TaxID=262324 RepID=UPI00363DD307